jgi:hypothetical protein
MTENTMNQMRMAKVRFLKSSDCRNKLHLLMSLPQSRSVIRPTISCNNNANFIAITNFQQFSFVTILCYLHGWVTKGKMLGEHSLYGLLNVLFVARWLNG